MSTPPPKMVAGRFRVTEDTTALAFPKGEVLDVTIERDRWRHLRRVRLTGRSWTGVLVTESLPRGVARRMWTLLEGVG